MAQKGIPRLSLEGDATLGTTGENYQRPPEEWRWRWWGFGATTKSRAAPTPSARNPTLPHTLLQGLLGATLATEYPTVRVLEAVDWNTEKEPQGRAQQRAGPSRHS